jgi:hypothetical protein
MTALARRIPVVLLAFLVANAAAALLITLCMFFEWEEVLRVSGAHPVRLAVGVFGLITSAKMVVAALLVIALAEHFRIRAIVLYVVAGGVGFAALAADLGVPPSASSATLMGRERDIMTGAGIVAGLAYWAIAGRQAGAWQDTGGMSPD